jgi:hypothetical protein
VPGWSAVHPGTGSYVVVIEFDAADVTAVELASVAVTLNALYDVEAVNEVTDNVVVPPVTVPVSFDSVADVNEPLDVVCRVAV